MRDLRQFRKNGSTFKKLMLLAGVAAFVAIVASIIVKSVRAIQCRYDDEDFFDDDLDLDVIGGDKKHDDCDCFANDQDFEK